MQHLGVETSGSGSERPTLAGEESVVSRNKVVLTSITMLARYALIEKGKPHSSTSTLIHLTQ